MFNIFVPSLFKKVLQLHDKEFTSFISASEIDFAIKQLAAQVEADFGNEVPVFIAVLNGSFMFTADFLRHYTKPCQVSFIKLASYQGMVSTDEVHTLIGLNEDLAGKSVVVLEDIVDTGTTIESLKVLMKKQQVKTCKVATLFFKPEAFKKTTKLDYIGIRIPNKFIVGFGLDYDGLGRNLRDVYQLKAS